MWSLGTQGGQTLRTGINLGYGDAHAMKKIPCFAISFDKFNQLL